MEACGMDSLASGDSVIMAHIPYTAVGATGIPPTGAPIEWFVVTACNDSKTCDTACETPPPDPLFCCGVPCSGWPETLNLTVEVLDGDCSPCTDNYVLNKQACEVGTIYNTSPTGVDCLSVPDAPFSVGFVRLSCAVQEDKCSPFASGHDPIFTLGDDFENEYTLDMETACCDPLFLEFTASTQECQPLMGSINANIKITITG